MSGYVRCFPCLRHGLIQLPEALPLAPLPLWSGLGHAFHGRPGTLMPWRRRGVTGRRRSRRRASPGGALPGSRGGRLRRSMSRQRCAPPRPPREMMARGRIARISDADARCGGRSPGFVPWTWGCQAWNRDSVSGGEAGGRRQIPDETGTGRCWGFKSAPGSPGAGDSAGFPARRTPSRHSAVGGAFTGRSSMAGPGDGRLVPGLRFPLRRCPA